MATITYQTYLMYGTGTGSSITWSKLCDIKDYPDLIDIPEAVEITTLSDAERTYTPGIRGADAKTFTANYEQEDFETIDAMKDTEMPLAVWFGAASDGTTPDGHDGKVQGVGKVNVGLPGGGVNDPRNMTVTCTMSKGFKPVTT